MIEFRGYITGAAEKHFHKAGRILGIKIFLIALLLLLPIFIGISITENYPELLIAYCSMFVIIPLLSMIPQSKRERMSITPKRIYTEGKYIICVADKYTESRLIREAKVLEDHGEFYMLVFPFGKISDKFVCQKDLIRQGTIQKFEALFAGKIVRKIK